MLPCRADPSRIVTQPKISPLPRTFHLLRLMGFTTAFFSGLTLTSASLYLCLAYHQRFRAHQAALLHQQALLLNSLTDPTLAHELATRADANYSGGLREGIRDYRPVKAAYTERWKDGKLCFRDFLSFLGGFSEL